MNKTKQLDALAEKRETLLGQIAALEEKHQAQAKQRERKLDTRRKIVLGGGLLALAKNDPAAADVLQRVIALTDERDRALFD